MFSEKLKKLRKNKNLRQEDMAKYLGITRQGYAKYENEDSEPSHAMLVKIADYFDVTTDFLLGRREKSAEIEVDKESLPIYIKLDIPKVDYDKLDTYQHEVLDWAVSQENFHFKNQSDDVLEMIERLEIAYEVEKAIRKRRNKK